MKSGNVHHEMQFSGGNIYAHQWVRVPKSLVVVEDVFSTENLHTTGRLYFAYIDFVTSILTKSHYLPPEAMIKTRWTNNILLWFSGIWASVTERESRLIMEVHKGALVHKNHYDEGEFSLRYQLQEKAGSDFIEFHVELKNFYSRFRGEKPRDRRRYLLYRMTQGAVHRHVTVSFAKRIASLLQNSEAPLKKLFGVSDETFLFWEDSQQVPEGQTLVNSPSS
ncbi:MAG: hypothetical protein MAGBODY4_00345 [Candidatus Marinimicrobia bacterium]|nr:hypothetical protein [Candidatus Neomarinimicrobiota bacterium]